MKTFDFKDVQLIPKKGIVDSRTECDTSVKLGNHTFKIPIVPSNMKTIIDEKLAIDMAKDNLFYIHHRFDVDTIKFVKKMKQLNLISSISIGTKKEWFDILDNLVKLNLIPDYITIDIAHGHCEAMHKMIKYIRKIMKNKTFIIAGNIATPQGVKDLETWGADATKVGVGPGKVCITRLKTGFGTAGWQLAAIASCAENATKPIIADGGIRFHGDIAKAIKFGATFAMSGVLLSAHLESPGKIIEQDGKKYKQYFGSASEYNKLINKNIEGKMELIPLKNSIWDTFRHIKEDLQSAISYSGGTKLMDLKKVDYVILNFN